MTKQYAKNTSVPVSRSQSEIEKELLAFGCTAFACGWQNNQAAVMFVVNNKQYRYEVRVTQDEDPKEARRLWRCVLATIKGKLIAVAEGISTFEEEFLSSMVMPNGQTAGQVLLPQIEEAHKSGRMPAALIGM